MLVNAIKLSLENMNKKFTNLSRLRFDEIDQTLKEKLQEQKILERPFAYEFYHQFRKLWNGGCILSIASEDIVIQAEVNKTYQRIPNLNKMPDFLLHKPNSNENLAVIEFKLASNNRQIEEDFKKLVAFNKRLGYKILIEVVIGHEKSLAKAQSYIEQLKNRDGEEINIIYFNTDSWRANDSIIKYNSNVA